MELVWIGIFGGLGGVVIIGGILFLVLDGFITGWRRY